MAQNLLDAICAENLGVYRASPIRLREDVSQEAQIASDYRGRLIYELLQNADDAMTDHASSGAHIVFRLTDEDLWVGNSGRPLNEADVKGLCGLGASSKGEFVGKRRASIGHKGMGFKSVLEITACPEAISEQFAFRMSGDLARGPVEHLMAELRQERPSRVPITRFPSTLDRFPTLWSSLREAGIRTLFRFPLRPELTVEQRSLLAERLLSLPATTILFLKHLGRVDVSVETRSKTAGFCWSVNRERVRGIITEPCHDLLESGIYRVRISSTPGMTHEFLLAHDSDVEIGSHRGGLNSFAWEGIELSEVSVAALIVDGVPAPLPADWRRLHVFLPTAEPCTYPLLINGAFVTDLSRQEVRVQSESGDYNQFLMTQAARLFRQALVPKLIELGCRAVDILPLLDRGVRAPEEPSATAAGRVLYRAMRDELETFEFLPCGDQGFVAPKACVVPPLIADPSLGERYRHLLGPSPTHEQRRFPDGTICRSEFARIVVDHGGIALSARAVAETLAASDLTKIGLRDHDSGGFRIDPILEILEQFWNVLGTEDRDELSRAACDAPLFPVSVEEGVVRRVKTAGTACFYPPRKLRGAVPLERLNFLMQELCWGALQPKERNQYLRDQFVAWQALFELREFKFPEVMQASVLPALALDRTEETQQQLARLQNVQSLAAICQLAGRTPDANRALRYERLGSNRALFNLSRLPVPCRGKGDQEIIWCPAYKAYLGEDWIGEASVERVLKRVRAQGNEAPEIPFLANPQLFDGLLAQFSHLEEAARTSEDDSASPPDDRDEVGIDEDAEAPLLDQADRARWIEFLTWLGVNRVLRPVHFHDVEDDATGWLTTRDFARPSGWAFKSLPGDLWGEFHDSTYKRVIQRVTETDGVPYLYAVHDLEHIVPLIKAAAGDKSTEIASALFHHFALNWPFLEPFIQAKAAVVPGGRVPTMRSQPKHAYDDEIVDIGDDLWLVRLRKYDWCPTTHGPRRPERVWLRSPEVERLFGRQSFDPGIVLPVLEGEESAIDGKTRKLGDALGIRAELTPSSFMPNDASGVFAAIERRYAEAAATGSISERDLRTIRPIYRTLMELLPGTEAGMPPEFSAGALIGVPLLIQNGQGSYRFQKSEHVLYSERSGTRERLGNPAELWTFVLEAERSAKGPLTTLLRTRVLEEEVVWTPQPGDAAFESDGMAQFRAGMRDLAPYVLSRLSAERRDDRLVAQDLRRLREFCECVVPVTELSVRCRLDDMELGTTVRRNAFVGVSGRGPTTAFIVWQSRPWPPSTPEESEALALALCDLLDAAHFEAFLALINAASEDSRRKLLRLSGASTGVEDARALLLSSQFGSSEDSPIEKATKSAGELPTDINASQVAAPVDSVTPRKTPLFEPSQLLVWGTPIVITATPIPPTLPASSTHAQSKRNGDVTRRYGGQTDLDELDQLGMHVALSFERLRLSRDNGCDAAIFGDSGGGDQSHALIFDVSTITAVESARVNSAHFRAALAVLQGLGVSASAPGFDILTLNPRRANGIDRLIELKSSGVNAQVQQMSWNEWKSARASDLRELYFLYLVGNLRSDLGDAHPFIRTVHDPFGTIWAEEVQQYSASRRIQLNLAYFKVAEHLDLQVVRGD